MSGIPLGRANPNPLRLAPQPDAPTLSHSEAQDAFRAHYKAARAECIKALQAFGGYLIAELLTAEKSVTVGRLRATRNEAQKVADHALAIVAELNKALDACGRVER